MFYALLFYLIVALFPIKRHFWANHDFSLSGNFCGAELNYLVSHYDVKLLSATSFNQV